MSNEVAEDDLTRVIRLGQLDIIVTIIKGDLTRNDHGAILEDMVTESLDLVLENGLLLGQFPCLDSIRRPVKNPMKILLFIVVIKIRILIE
jgi:hypothetical protein